MFLGPRADSFKRTLILRAGKHLSGHGLIYPRSLMVGRVLSGSIPWCISPTAHLLQCVIQGIHRLYFGNIHNSTEKMKRNFIEDLKTFPLKRFNALYTSGSTWLLSVTLLGYVWKTNSPASHVTSLTGQFIITFAFELFTGVYDIRRNVHLLSVHGLAHIQILNTLV